LNTKCIMGRNVYNAGRDARAPREM
jgi:hypothetical protein